MLTLALYTIAFAADPVAPKAPPGPPPELGMMQFLPFVLMFVVFWFLLIRPQQKRLKETQEMQSALKKGEEVVTNSGIFGKITGVTDKVVTLEIADNVRIKILKSQVSAVVKGDQPIVLNS